MLDFEQVFVIFCAGINIIILYTNTVLFHNKLTQIFTVWVLALHFSFKFSIAHLVYRQRIRQVLQFQTLSHLD